MRCPRCDERLEIFSDNATAQVLVCSRQGCRVEVSLPFADVIQNNRVDGTPREEGEKSDRNNPGKT